MSAPELAPPFPDVDATAAALEAADYLADRETAVVAWLAGQLGRPLLLEGPPGVGKTELAKAVSRATGRPLLRLQCYEGLDEAKALYEWEYGKQMLYTQLVRDSVAQTDWQDAWRLTPRGLRGARVRPFPRANPRCLSVARSGGGTRGRGWRSGDLTGRRCSCGRDRRPHALPRRLRSNPG